MAEREVKVIIRLTAEKKEEFQRLAEELGVTMSALGAYVIGNFLRTQKMVIEKAAADAKAEEWSA